MSYEQSPFPLRDAVTPPPPPDSRWLQTPVRAFMRPGVVTVAADASLLQVQRAMVSHGVHAVLITAPGGPLGWVTAAGLLPWLAKEPALYTAEAAVTEAVAYIPPGASARDALRVFAGPAWVTYSSARAPPSRRRG
jgi:CBS domain-containing protein